MLRPVAPLSLLLAGLLTVAGPSFGVRTAEAEGLRPIDRLRSQPPLSSSLRSPAIRSRDAADRQAQQSRLRGLEQQGLKGGSLSPTIRAQKAIPRGPGLSQEAIGQARRDLNDLNNLLGD